MNENNIKILVVDDEIKITDVVKSYMENVGYTVYTAFSGIEALKAFEKYDPDLVILDLMLPDISGEEICIKLRKNSRVPIIMLTAKVEEEDILRGLGIGADDYIVKPFSPRQLVARAIAILRRAANDAAPLTNILSFNNGELHVDLVKHEVRKRDKIVNLTPNEYKILVTMIKYPKKAFTRDELVLMALGDDYEGYDRTIDTHIKNLRSKLEDDTKTPRYILTVYGVGYKFGGE